jgi:hypothetical protein
MEAQSNANLRLVPRNNVVPFEPRSSHRPYEWVCHQQGCSVAVQARYESLAAHHIARHWTDTHDPKDAA